MVQPSWCAGVGTAYQIIAGRAAVAGGAEPRPGHGPGGRAATCPTIACWSWPWWRTSSARSSPRWRRPWPSSGCSRLPPHPGGGGPQGGPDRSTVANTLTPAPPVRGDPRPHRDGPARRGPRAPCWAWSGRRIRRALAREAVRAGSPCATWSAGCASARAPAAPPAAQGPQHAGGRGAAARPPLGTRVEISRRGRAGTLRIAFATEARAAPPLRALLRAGRGRPRERAGTPAPRACYCFWDAAAERPGSADDQDQGPGGEDLNGFMDEGTSSTASCASGTPSASTAAQGQHRLRQHPDRRGVGPGGGRDRLRRVSIRGTWSRPGAGPPAHRGPGRGSGAGHAGRPPRWSSRKGAFFQGECDMAAGGQPAPAAVVPCLLPRREQRRSS
jgi:hypothetical protein